MFGLYLVSFHSLSSPALLMHFISFHRLSPHTPLAIQVYASFLYTFMFLYSIYTSMIVSLCINLYHFYDSYIDIETSLCSIHYSSVVMYAVLKLQCDFICYSDKKRLRSRGDGWGYGAKGRYMSLEKPSQMSLL